MKWLGPIKKRTMDRELSDDNASLDQCPDFKLQPPTSVQRVDQITGPVEMAGSRNESDGSNFSPPGIIQACGY